MPAEKRGSFRHFVALSRNITNAKRSAAEVILCSGIFVPGV